MPLALLAAGGAVGCPAEKPPVAPEPGEVVVCPVDHFREYFCDDLLPLASTLPAPEPFESCPGSVDSHVGVGDPLPAAAGFDIPYTQHIRKRAPPGNACCYSWCSPVAVPDPALVPADRGCKVTPHVREEFCFDRMETGTTRDAGGPFAGCPIAVVPPRAASFAQPAAAGFDPQVTGARRQQGFESCCYTWCSPAVDDPISTPMK